MNTSGHLQSKWSPSGFTLTLQETGSIQDGRHLLCKRTEVFMIPWTFQIIYIYISLYLHIQRKPLMKKQKVECKDWKP